MSKRTASAAYWLGVAIGAYLSVSTVVYRFRHPHKTETECLLSLPDALLWR